MMTAGFRGKPCLEQIVRCLSAARFTFVNELELQDGIQKLLEGEGLSFRREARLSATDRIDFLIGETGLEVKTDGSLNDVLRQLHRYAQLDQIQALILVTNRARHNDMPDTLNHKPLRVINISMAGAF